MAKVPEPDEVIILAQALKDARAKVAELEQRWQSFFTVSDEIETAQEQGRVSLQARIVALLDDNPDEIFTAGKVTSALNANPNSVGPLLSRLVGERKIDKVSHGEYRSLGNKNSENHYQDYEQALLTASKL